MTAIIATAVHFTGSAPISSCRVGGRRHQDRRRREHAENQEQGQSDEPEAVTKHLPDDRVRPAGAEMHRTQFGVGKRHRDRDHGSEQERPGHTRARAGQTSPVDEEHRGCRRDRGQARSRTRETIAGPGSAERSDWAQTSVTLYPPTRLDKRPWLAPCIGTPDAGGRRRTRPVMADSETKYNVGAREAPHPRCR